MITGSDSFSLLGFRARAKREEGATREEKKRKAEIKAIIFFIVAPLRLGIKAALRLAYFAFDKSQ